MHGVRAAQVDVAARVAANEVVQHHLAGHEALLDATHRGQLHLHVVASGAADAQRVLVLVVHVDQGLGLQDARLQIAGAIETRLLVARHEHFQRSVLDGLVSQNGERGGNTSTIISTQRGSRSHQVLAVDNAGSQRILAQINLNVVILLDDHIHMALKAHHGLVLASGVGSLADNQVLTLIHVGLAAKLLSLGLQEVTHLDVSPQLVSHVRSTRNLGQSKHVSPNEGRLRKNLHHLLTITTCQQIHAILTQAAEQ